MIKIKNIGLALAVSALAGQPVMADVADDFTPEVEEEIAAVEIKKGESHADIAKQLANPIAALISLPIQFNYDRGFLHTHGNDSNKWIVNVQPVIPFSLNEDWNIISRTIVPLVRTENFPVRHGVHDGVGDLVQSVFFSPKAPTDNGWIWGCRTCIFITFRV